ncbi:uncharacterized protein PFL1_03751 [Pseudozyma flocculosa PF-1]|uniref:Polyketide synthase n=2 Tax=Pseudozyma flocculosa TaxID=84751 RepID=A0A5C3F379_9BASI|nr:uncharacterized protein PFL1_03751 [Pseudozyma flocculosa PF-1]EPQ28951.1 hypothetical protein PFL1_03751 [Pseudozyma flocculosa PF-1]SPO38560.1 uncharacterized protein PSFLO_04038 [Pseudozyma flocculosa]
MVLSSTDAAELARSPLSYLEQRCHALHIGASLIPGLAGELRWRRVATLVDRSYKVKAFTQAAFKAIRKCLQVINASRPADGQLVTDDLSLQALASPAFASRVELTYALEVTFYLSTILGSLSAVPNLRYETKKFEYRHIAAYGAISGPLCRDAVQDARTESELMFKGIEAVKLATILGFAVKDSQTAGNVALLVRLNSTLVLPSELIPIGTAVDSATIYSAPRQLAATLQHELEANGQGCAAILGVMQLIEPSKAQQIRQAALDIYETGGLRPRSFQSDHAARALQVALDASLHDFEAHQNAVDSIHSTTKQAGCSSAASDRPKIEFVGCSLSFIRDHTDICQQVAGAHIRPHALDSDRPISSDPSRRSAKASTVIGTPAGEIAIVGMGCHVPGGGEGHEAFWRLLQDGLDVHQPVPERLFNIKDYKSASYRDRNTLRANHMNALERPEIFDPAFFGIDDDFALKMDPQQRLALQVVHDTLGTAAYHPGATKSFDPARMGIFVGVCSDDYRENVSIDIQRGFTDGTFRAQIANRISNFYGWQGPSVTLDTACSSALVAIESACSYLAAGKCDAAIAGGVNVLTQPQIFIGLDRGFFLNSTGQCKTFDEGGDGYSRADAVSFVMLKRMQDAVAEGDRILGTICSAATNHSGESHSITHPHAPTQRRLYEANLLAAGLRPCQLAYLECHGTGTQAGDGQEMAGILSIFGKDKERTSQLIVGSAKANVGHSESASGATSLVKTLMCLGKQQVPPHVGIKGVMNKGFGDLSRINIPINGAEMRPAGCDARYAMVSNFSAAGGNTNMIIREGRAPTRRAITGLAYEALPDLNPRKHIFAISAKSTASLSALVARYLAHIRSGGIDLAELCYNSTGRRLHQTLRVSGVVSNLEDVKKLLETQKVDETSPPVRAPGRLAFIFSGQGSQYINMARELFDSVPHFRRCMQRCSRILAGLGYPGFLDAIYPAADAAGEPLAPTPYENQVGIFALEYSLAQLWLSWGLQPCVVAGHSLGEYASLCVAGVLSLHDTLYLVATRATMMVEHCKADVSGMLAVRDTPIKVEEVLGQAEIEHCDIACRNGPQDTVVAGPLESIEAAAKALETAHIKAFRVSVPYAFHSTAIEPLLVPFAEAAKKVKFNAPQIAVLSNVHGRVVRPGEDDVFGPDYVLAHARRVVRFGESIHDFASAEENREVKLQWLEIGPHPISLPMIKGVLADIGRPAEPSALVPSLKKGTDSYCTLLSAVNTLFQQGFNIRWPSFHVSTATVTRTIEMPAYPFEEKKFWKPFQDRGLRDHLVKPRPALVSRIPSRQRKQGRPPKRSGGQSRPSQRFQSKYTLLSDATMTGSLATDDLSFVIDAAREPSEALIMGHLIRGKGMMSATLISELALEVGYFAFKHESPNEPEPTFQLRNVNMFAPFLKDAGGSVGLQVKVRGTLSSAEGLHVELFTAKDANRAASHHASCYVRIDDGQGEKEWKDIGAMIEGRIESLQKNAESCFRKELAYQLFENVVEYTDVYRGMDQIYMTDTGDEATAVVVRSMQPTARFVCDPALQDSFGQLSGFIPNVGIVDGDHVAIANGIKSIHFSQALIDINADPAANGPYLTYCRMVDESPNHDGVYVGDIYITDPQGRYLGLFGGVQFKRVKKGILDRLMCLGGSAKAAASSKVPAVKAVSKPAYNPHCEPAKTVSEPAAVASRRTGTDGGRNGAAPLPQPQLVRLSSSTIRGKAPLLLFPDGSGSPYAYLDLAACLPTTSETLAFQSPFFDSAQAWTGRLDQLVSVYVSSILQQYPEPTSLMLGGWSIGGLIALKVGASLCLHGYTIRQISLIDSPIPDPVLPLSSEALEIVVGRIRKSVGIAGAAANKRQDKIERHFRDCVSRLAGEVIGPAFLDGVPGIGKILLVDATIKDAFQDVMSNDVMRWRKVLGTLARIEIKKVKADHSTVVRQPAVEEVARCM